MLKQTVFKRQFRLDEIDLISHDIVKSLSPGEVMGFMGPLGSGKTTLIKSIASILGVTTLVSSPTYVLEHVYDARNKIVISHWDLFRLRESPEELIEKPNRNTIRLIEWPEKVDCVFSGLDFLVEIQFSDAIDERAISFFSSNQNPVRQL